MTVGGLAYQITWATVNPSFSVPYTQFGAGNGNCYGIPGANLSQVVISKITLPNGKLYQFSYNNNPYGLLSQITYPDGGTVVYTWKLSDNANALADGPGATPNGQGGWNPVKDGCIYEYKTPVVATRTVGNGSSTQLTQSFVYSTTWNSLGTQWTGKTTNVTTTDNVRNISSVTGYTYSSIIAPPVPFANVTTSIPVQIPVETSTNYCDWGSTTSCTAGWLKEVNKVWYDQYNLKSAQTVLDNAASSNITYCYIGNNCVPSLVLPQLQSKAESDFGGALLRTTTNAYQGFSGTPGFITNSPCSTKITDGGGNRIAETDYYYDGGTSLCAAITAASAHPIALRQAKKERFDLFQPARFVILAYSGRRV